MSRPEHSPEKRPPGVNDWVETIRQFGNPLYHFRRFLEDLDASRKALVLRRQILRGEITDVPWNVIFRGKLFGVFFATGWTSLLGVGLGYSLQLATRSQWIGLYVTPVLIYIVTAVAYQVGWFLDNQAIYNRLPGDAWERFRRFQSDLLPVHLTALKFAIGFNLLNLLAGTLIVGLITWASKAFAQVFPASLTTMVIEAVFIAGPFVRIMGDFFDRYSFVLADQYAEMLEEGVQSD